ncbi:MULTISPECIES: tripartite tricarboxylate transporter substrate binding protein [unclassified Chelatococcus]|uniref:Bug family tripartite tricarboxylate transporter substrate binding protein n=1 Tax=unclassified Chelatococcus TaxID=2638111 RepID=UPI001BCBFF2F|nr:MULTISPECIES: tripartite tricarboxylate transporter substrate binding protein [unclassified Chelatococcus]MBS7700400.1 tripartite tricarboxylate transporter substrate binding protein [Chelatococcus sp. YT9]MBX3556196.1 tripartite tricarboxylate transporter substrate binding protein [Chelatococcus sp.]
MIQSTTRRLALTFICLTPMLSALPALAQSYPQRPIRLIVPFPAGGATDLMGRVLAKAVETRLGRPLIVENKPGAGTMTGLNELAGARPDGYTIGMVTSTMVLQPLYGGSRHDYPTTLQPIAQITVTPPVLVTGAETPWKTAKDLIEDAKAHPKKIKYGITGFGNSSHIGPTLLARAAGIEIEPVSFDGGGVLLTALLGGHIAVSAGSTVDYKSHIEAGKLRALLSFGPERSKDPLYKDVPTAKELGYDAEIVSWTGVAAPKGLPSDIANTLGDAFKDAMADGEVRDALHKLGSEPIHLDAAGFGARWASETAKLRVVLTETGILELVKSQRR